MKKIFLTTGFFILSLFIFKPCFAATSQTEDFESYNANTSLYSQNSQYSNQGHSGYQTADVADDIYYAGTKSMRLSGANLNQLWQPNITGGITSFDLYAKSYYSNASFFMAVGDYFWTYAPSLQVGGHYGTHSNQFYLVINQPDGSYDNYYETGIALDTAWHHIVLTQTDATWSFCFDAYCQTGIDLYQKTSINYFQFNTTGNDNAYFDNINVSSIPPTLPNYLTIDYINTGVSTTTNGGGGYTPDLNNVKIIGSCINWSDWINCNANETLSNPKWVKCSDYATIGSSTIPANYSCTMSNVIYGVNSKIITEYSYITYPTSSEINASSTPLDVVYPAWLSNRFAGGIQDVVSYYSSSSISSAISGLKVHDIVCSEEDWTYSGSNIFISAKCNILETLLSIPLGIINWSIDILKIAVNFFVDKVTNIFPFVIIKNIFLSWQGSATATLPSQLNWLLGENGKFYLYIPSAWGGTTSSIEVWGSDIWGTNTATTNIYASIRFLSTYLEWTIFLFSLYGLAQEVVRVSKGGALTEPEEITVHPYKQFDSSGYYDK